MQHCAYSMYYHASVPISISRLHDLKYSKILNKLSNKCRRTCSAKNAEKKQQQLECHQTGQLPIFCTSIRYRTSNKDWDSLLIKL